MSAWGWLTEERVDGSRTILLLANNGYRQREPKVNKRTRNDEAAGTTGTWDQQAGGQGEIQRARDTTRTRYDEASGTTRLRYDYAAGMTRPPV